MQQLPNQKNIGTSDHKFSGGLISFQQSTTCLNCCRADIWWEKVQTSVWRWKVSQLLLDDGLSDQASKMNFPVADFWSPKSTTTTTKEVNSWLALFVTDTLQNSVDSLSFETLIPKSIVQRYISLLLEHRRIILCGPSGTGKTFLAQKLAEYLTIKWVSDSKKRWIGEKHILCVWVVLLITFVPCDFMCYCCWQKKPMWHFFRKWSEG